MIIGVPKEIKDNENRVALTPAGAEALCGTGHRVLLEAGAGLGSGFADETYAGYGAEILSDKRRLFDDAEMILKVKEPLPAEYDLLHEGQVLFTYLHLAPERELTKALLARKITGIAYETIEGPDRSLPLLTPMSEIAGRITTIMSNRYNIASWTLRADLLIGAVLIPGAKAPRLVTEAMVKTMEPGSVIVDVAIDQGGCIETIDRVTSHSHPTFVRHGVIHYAVPNMPGAVARTSTIALTNVTIGYALQIAAKGWIAAVQDDPGFAKGVNLTGGKVTYRAVAEALGLPFAPLEEAI